MIILCMRNDTKYWALVFKFFTLPILRNYLKNLFLLYVFSEQGKVDANVLAQGHLDASIWVREH